MLIEDIRNTTKYAFSNYTQERFQAMCSPIESNERLVVAMQKVDKLKEEILSIVEECSK
jgi:hypothetical protein